MLRKANFAPEHYYHVYNRGTDKRDIFLNESDYLRFTVLLYICNNTEPVHIQKFISQGRSLTSLFDIKRKETLVDIGAHCLMPNHFHLLIKEKSDSGITVLMKKLCTAYSMYFNKKNERTGNLFQGRFKSELVDTDQYLKYLFAYIHLNPIKLIESQWKEKGIKNLNQAKKFLDNYQWSSYQIYTGRKQNDPVLNIKEFPEYFENFNEFNMFIGEWLSQGRSSMGLIEHL